MKQALDILVKFRNFIVLLAVISLVGYTGYEFSKYIVIVPTAEQIEAERKNVSAKSIRFDTKTIDAVAQQILVPVDTTPRNVGKTDPFF